MSGNDAEEDDKIELPMSHSNPSKVGNQPNETLPPIEEYIPEYNHFSKCVKCEDTGAYEAHCSGKRKRLLFFTCQCEHGLAEQHIVRKCKRCSHTWNEACLDGRPRGGLKLEMINDLWVVVRLTYPDKGADEANLKKRLEDIRVIAQNLNGYINIL